MFSLPAIFNRLMETLNIKQMCELFYLTFGNFYVIFSTIMTKYQFEFRLLKM